MWFLRIILLLIVIGIIIGAFKIMMFVIMRIGDYMWRLIDKDERRCK